MSMADDSPDDRSAGAERTAPSSPPAAASPALRASLPLRIGALASVFAAVSALVLHGLEANARESVVVKAETVASTLAYFMAAVLVGLVAWGSFESLRAKRALLATRAICLVASAIVVSITGLSLEGRLRTTAAVVLAIAASVSALASAFNAMRATHTRAVGVVIGVFGFAALARVGAWQLSMMSDGADGGAHLVVLSRGLVTAGVVLEGLGQLAAAAWLGTRSRIAGQLLSSVAIMGAFAITWGVAKGKTSGVLWQTVLNRALGDTPWSYGLDAVAVFLASAAILLALVAAAQPKQVTAIVTVLSLGLISRGSFDVPLRALAIAAAAHWLTVAMGDDRAMWRVLLDARGRRIGPRENTRSAPPPSQPAAADAKGDEPAP